MEIPCPKSNQNFRDITRNVKENEILHEIFRVVTCFPRYVHFVLYLGKSITFSEEEELFSSCPRVEEREGQPWGGGNNTPSGGPIGLSSPLLAVTKLDKFLFDVQAFILLTILQVA